MAALILSLSKLERNRLGHIRMLKGFFIFLIQWISLVVHSIYFLLSKRPKNFFRYSLLIIFGLPILLFLQLFNWFGFLIDEIFFKNYRAIKVTKPLFILGVPRSGTTFLQRTLARDSQLTTTQLWECLFAPSVSQRYLWKYLAVLLSPIGKIFGVVTSKFNHKMNTIHSLGLSEAEEDFLLLLPILHSFIQMVIFPGLSMNWRLAFIDRDFNFDDRDFVLGFYHRMVQKHLYFHGQEKVYLTKNPSFTSLLDGLLEFYPDAQFIACVRAPENTVPSQFASLVPAFDLLGHDLENAEFKQSVIEMLSYYYQHIAHCADKHDRCKVITMDELKQELLPSIYEIYRRCGWNMSEELSTHYQTLADKNKNFKSSHQYAQTETDDSHIFESFNGFWPLPENLSLLEKKQEV